MKPKILVAAEIPQEVESYLVQHCEVVRFEGTRKELLEQMKDKEGILQMGVQIDSEFLAHAPLLKAISSITVGYNNLDLKAIKDKNIIGTNTAGTLDETVADLVLGLMLSVARRIPQLDCHVKKRNWKADDDKNLYGVDMYGAKLGIIGMGRIGEAVAKRAKYGFNMEVCYYNRNPKPAVEQALGVSYLPFLSLLESADFIVVMTPYTKETHHLIDFKEFSLMKETAIFVNASRGQTVNELALIDALENERIFGAGLDVYEEEPLDHDNPLLKLTNAVTLPHIGSATAKTRFRMAMVAAENLVAALAGETPPNLIPELK